jgi:ribonuclease T
MIKQTDLIKERFRGFLPVVIDVETAGFEAKTDALLELAAIPIEYDDDKNFVLGECFHYHIKPFEGAKINQDALEFNKIDPDHPFRFAISEKDALEDLYPKIRAVAKKHNCQRAVLVGHNAWFDLSFINAATTRTKLKSPLHGFTSFDTATLSALFYGQTVLSKALMAAKLGYNAEEAHSAVYDTKQTAKLFCKMLNDWNKLK